MRRKLQGKHVTTTTGGERVKAFVPAPLPPKPAIEWTPELRDTFDQAMVELGRLDSVSSLFSETSHFLYMYVRKEAVLSSMIEGTQSSLSDLLLYELEQQPGVPLDDVREVSNYIAALNHGLDRVRKGFPISLRLFREIHRILLSKGRGSGKSPGQFRKSQNWIGGSRPGNATFVPPPPESVMDCMGKLECFLNDQPEPTPILLKAALAHVQFETIHPFLDGNGRLGRLLITLLLCEQNLLHEPMLYLSLYFKTHRSFYYELLNRVRLTGDWEAWLQFFAEAVVATAKQATETAKRLYELANTDRARIDELGRAAASALKVHHVFLERPITTVALLSERAGLSPVTINKSLAHLCRLNIITEITGQKRNRVFCYRAFIELLNEGTELPE